MKLINSIAISIAAASAMFIVGCANDSAKLISSEQLSYRNVSLNENVSTPKVQYSTAAAGTSKRIKRAFQDAPPMIPHSVDGMLPITKTDNQCITCHVDSAPYDKTIPSVPVSHFTNFRPSASYALKHANTSSEKQANVSIKPMKTLYQGRYNCSQCHAPQATNVKLITDSKFTAQYATKDGAFKSSWDEDEFMRSIDTTK